jgi:hypothetical protein
LDQQGSSRPHGAVGYPKSKLRRGRSLQIGAVLLILCDTIRHMLEGTRPIDLWMLAIELLVLLLIAYEVGIGVVRSREDKKRAGLVCVRSEKIREIITRGQELQREAPRSGTAPMEAATWIDAEREWHKGTKALLESYSPQAAVALMHDTSGEAPPWWDSIATGARNEYATLICSLNNLRDILERPNVYL